MSLRVVHVVRQFLPSRGGMEDVVFNIARMQQELHGQRPSVITLDRVFRQSEVLPPDEVMDGIPVHRLPYSGSERYPLFPAVLKNLGEADVVHVHGIDFAFVLPHRGFHRAIGQFSETRVSPEGRILSQAEWDAQQHNWLPSATDEAFVHSLMKPVTEPGKYASWIAPPARGINGKPVEFEYVKLVG